MQAIESKARGLTGILRLASCALRLVPCFLLLASCSFPGSTAPVLKFGLVAPFEGRYRPVGYDAIYAARLAVREANAAGGVGGYRVELVAYDDGGQEDAAVERARQLVLDPQIVAAIGHLRVDTTRAAWNVYSSAGLPLLAPVIPANALPGTPCAGCGFPAAFRSAPTAQALRPWAPLDDVLAGLVPTGTVFATGAPWPQDALNIPGARQFIAEYMQVSGSAQPGPYAWAVYQSAQMLFDAMRSLPASGARDRSARLQVGARLAGRFDASGAWPDTPVYRYQIEQQGKPVRVP